MIKIFGKEFKKIESANLTKVYEYKSFRFVVHPNCYFFMCSNITGNTEFGNADLFTIVSDRVKNSFEEEIDEDMLLKAIVHHEDLNQRFLDEERYNLVFEIPKDDLEDLIGKYLIFV